MIDFKGMAKKRSLIQRRKAALAKALRPDNPYPKEFLAERIGAIRQLEEELEEMKAALVKELPKLTGERRQIVKAHYLDGVRVEDLAEAYGITKNGVYFHLEKAKDIINGSAEP